VSAPKNLKALFAVIVDEAQANPEFAARIEAAMSGELRAPPTPKKSARRPRGVIDPYEAHRNGELRQRLEGLEIEQLKDLVAEHGMGPIQLAMKWRKPDRLIDLIEETVVARAHKGDVFRAPNPGPESVADVANNSGLSESERSDAEPTRRGRIE
jgi:hypothetical protein